ncbi:hypothetical protein M0R45_035534 [Rubus argutus]|uniref:Jacalin-type lectin domain-containing protein n=1 Tax=Rubus argutus TaxID=59490 RepID=A0AAW1VTH2_RUBAR
MEDAGVLLEYVFGYEGLEPEQMVLTKLREITLCYLVNLISIWNGPAPYQVFRNLKSLALRGCHKLKSVFPSSVAECLGQLELLWVEECSGLETVIESWETDINEVVIPQLKDIYLSSLLQLTGIYSDIRGIPIIHKVFCPSLEHLYVYGCPKLSNLAVFDLRRGNQVQANDDRHFAIIFERLFHRQFNPEKIPQFFSKKSSDDFFSSRAYGSDKEGVKFDDGIYSTVRQLVLHYNNRWVNCIQIEYDRNGFPHRSDKHGHPNGEKTTVMLDYPDEFITSVCGTYAAGPRSGIGSLTFQSNKNTYGPFGSKILKSRTFSIEKQGSKIVGFHGTVGTYSSVFGLRAIGAHFKACSEWP